MNQLIKPNQDNGLLIPISPTLDDSQFAELATSTKFLPRVQLFGHSTKAVKMGKFPVGHYGLVAARDVVEDLGEEFDCLPINVRPKAMDLNGDQVISIFKKDSEEFRRIVEESTNPNSGCMWGPEFLLWLPVQKKFATMLFGNPTMRRESPMMKELLGKAATCRSHFIESKQYGGWHGPQVVPCSTPFDIPDFASIKEQDDLFRNPSEKEVELAGAETERAR